MLLVERHFLKTYGGGFTENFYGLKRERVLRTKGAEIPRAQLGAAKDVREALQLTSRDVWRNLAVTVGIPYVKRKLDEGYEIHAAHAGVLGLGYNRDRDGLPPDATVRQRLMYYYKWFLRRVYPSVNAAYYFSLLFFSLAYLFDGSKFHSPFLWLIGTRVRRMGRADFHAIEMASLTQPAGHSKGTKPGEALSFFNPRLFARTVYPRLLSSLRILLPTSIFALKFLEWWHASDFARQLSRKATEGVELPPPLVDIERLPRAGRHQPPAKSSVSLSGGKNRPASSEKRAETAQTPQPDAPIAASSLLPIFTVPAPTESTSSACPICEGPINNPTASPSGHVYCYVCIHKWVGGSHERQAAFMEGAGGEEGWAGEEGSREGRWESGRGRDAVTGKAILGGTEGLRRVIV